MKCEIFFFISIICLAFANEKSLKVSNGNVKFNLNLYHLLAKDNENLFYSPISLHTILSLLSQGATGETLNLINNALNATDEDCKEGYKDIITLLNGLNGDKGVQLNVANKIYVKNSYKLKESFKNVAVENYFSDIESVNFGDSINAANSINQWIESKTNDKIHNLISKDDLNPLTRMILVNAIYFKGQWLHKFKASQTRKSPFFASETETVNVPFMTQEVEVNYAHIEELNAEVIELPYSNRFTRMSILLPKDRHGIKDLEEKMKSFDFSNIRRKMRTVLAKIKLPKFKFESTLFLDEPLKMLGLSKLFENADLDGLLETKEELSVSKVLQKAFIEVNEEGSVAAVSSALGVQGRSGRIMVPDRITFIADHPFLFSINIRQHVSENLVYIPLFTGKLVHP